MFNRDSKFKQILQKTEESANGSQKRIDSSTFLHPTTEETRQKSTHSSQNLLMTQNRPYTAKMGSQQSLNKLPDQRQQNTQTQQRGLSLSQSNTFLKNRNVSSPHQQQRIVKIKNNNVNISQSQIASTQSGLTFKSLENISSQNLNYSNQQYTNQSIKMSTPLKKVPQFNTIQDRYQKQNEGLTQISDSYLDDQTQQDASYHIQQALNSIKVEQVIKLFESKCEDIKIEVSFPQLIKFVDRVQKQCQDGKLDLSEQALGTKSAHIIANIIQNNSNFSTLNLNRNNIKDEGALVIAQSIINNPNICIINIANNNLSSQGCQYFFELLSTSESIYALNISSPESYNRNKMNQQTAKVIQQMLKVNQTLGFLDISHSQLGPQGNSQNILKLKNINIFFDVSQGGNSKVNILTLKLSNSLKIEQKYFFEKLLQRVLSLKN